MASEATQPRAVLPLSIIAPVDLGRALRELAVIDNQLMQHDLMAADKTISLPELTPLLTEIITETKLDIRVPQQRKTLIEFLESVREQAPILHFSFGSNPSPQFMQKLVTWLRQEIHPSVLVIVGLQPNIGMGCHVRSTNKYFDLSLRQKFTQNRELLMAKLREAPAS